MPMHMLCCVHPESLRHQSAYIIYPFNRKVCCTSQSGNALWTAFTSAGGASDGCIQSSFCQKSGFPTVTSLLKYAISLLRGYESRFYGLTLWSIGGVGNKSLFWLCLIQVVERSLGSAILGGGQYYGKTSSRKQYSKLIVGS